MLFQNNVEKKANPREHWTYIDKYEAPSEENIKCISDCPGPPLLLKRADDGEVECLV